MKNLILILTVVTMFVSCNKNKNNAKSLTPQQIYCVWIDNSNGTRTFYKCVETDAEMQQLNIKLRNENKFHTDYRKNDCSECQ